RRAKVEHVVLLSLFHADNDLLFARAHRDVEQHIRASGMQWTFLRPNGFMQNLFAVAQSIQHTGQFHFPVGDAKVSHIDVGDIGAVAAKVLTEGPANHGGKIYELSGPEALSYTQIAQTLSEVLGKPVTYVDVPPEPYKQTLLQYGVPPFIADGLLDLYRHYRTGDAAKVTPWVEQVTGRPATRFADFARGFAAALR
ncbi:MAG TPA: NmrA family NAD(P)-binding protein, partial [Myxococcaceae bacterium]